MSALEDSLRKVYKLPQAKPRLMDGSPLQAWCQDHKRSHRMR